MKKKKSTAAFRPIGILASGASVFHAEYTADASLGGLRGPVVHFERQAWQMLELENLSFPSSMWSATNRRKLIRGTVSGSKLWPLLLWSKIFTSLL